MKDIRQSKRYSDYLTRLGWVAKEKNGVYYFIRKIPLLGNIIKIQRPAKIDYTYIDVCVLKYKPFQIILEPQNLNYELGIRNYGFKKAKSTYLPSKTVVLDLTKNEKQLLSEMHYKTRYNIKKTKNLKLKTQNTKDINLFADFWQECAKKQRRAYISQKKEIIALFNAFKNSCSIVFVYSSPTSHYPLPPRPLAGIFNIYTKDTAYYMYAAASNEGKKLFAPTIAAWESIKMSKKRGCKFYDFEGIYDERFPIASWKGFSRFKLSFGGEIVEYPGCYTNFIWRNLFKTK